jgi:hypothetical protein
VPIVPPRGEGARVRKKGVVDDPRSLVANEPVKGLLGVFFAVVVVTRAT